MSKAQSKASKCQVLASVQRLAYRPEEFAAAVGLPLSTIRTWLADYVSSGGVSGLPHTRPMPHTILIWADDLPRWRSRIDAVRLNAVQSISSSEKFDLQNPAVEEDAAVRAMPSRFDEVGKK